MKLMIEEYDGFDVSGMLRRFGKQYKDGIQKAIEPILARYGMSITKGTEANIDADYDAEYNWAAVYFEFEVPELKSKFNSAESRNGRRFIDMKDFSIDCVNAVTQYLESVNATEKCYCSGFKVYTDISYDFNIFTIRCDIINLHYDF